MSLPIINLENLFAEDNQIRQDELNKLDHACREIGFIYLSHHGISQALIDKMFVTIKNYFDRPLEEKRKIEITNSRNHRGYGFLGEEQLDEKGQKDWKETFDMALDIPLDHAMAKTYPTMYGPNQYPDDPEFVETFLQYYQQGFNASQKLLTAMAQALGEPDHTFTQHFSTHVTALRAIHYPPRPEPEHDNGAGAHTDYGCVTLLLQDMVGGLQVKHKTDGWIDAPPTQGCLVVNIGDLMQRWTNDQYVSTSHRVKASQAQVHRYSIPLFVEPDYDTPVTCLPSCQNEQLPAKYEPVLAGDWIQSRFDATYAYRAEGE